ncbi:flagellar hook-basal body complex protein [Hathewaya histolytica]|uniref:Flagellar hook protein FlgE n=1 Tax=Hathewaya histolytica TaxID=1498 RepID=A0A4U9RG69_HATHI|nr:flagellar hook-basal body complex protein [Hathewaya histolytica]VTQ87720.1 flagellar basal-body rod protein FlgG [Hathewaya histolytica]
MLRSMYSGISGMKVNQSKLDVIGNNIANVGTTAFKGSRVRFQDMLSQSLIHASAPSRNQGGVNVGQVGLGVKVSGIDSIVTQGMMQPTGRNLDVAIDGLGYLLVGAGELPQSNAEGVSIDGSNFTIKSTNGMSINYSRDGALALDEQGNLLTSDGYRILGYAVNEKGGYNAETLSIDYNKNGLCSFVDANSKYGIKAGSTLVPLRIPDSMHVKASIVNGEAMSFVGKGDRGYINNNGTPKITINAPNNQYLGDNDIKVEVKYGKTDTDTTLAWRVYVNGEHAGKTGENIDLKALGFTTVNSTLNASAPSLNTSVSDDEKIKYSWSTDISAEGNKRVRTFMVEKNGVLKAVLEDGKVGVLGQLALASFKNSEGLERMGKNLYGNSPNSGEAVIRSGIGSDISNEDGFGDCIQGMLEMSNVDLAEQFTEMIVANRAFQASSKMISTGDEVLQDIINLKR